MTDKERLIELLYGYYSEGSDNVVSYFTKDDCEKIADYLLENGAVVLPCKIGDTVYEIHNYHCCTSPDLDYCNIKEKCFRLDMLNKINKTIFLSREEAEQALGGKSNG